jgi:hypothetical protein
MENDYRKQIPENYPPDSRIWIYQSDRKLLPAEAEAITLDLDQFCSQWKSHGAAVKALGRILMNRFIILIADEREASVSGCSTDSSVKAMQSLEEKYQLRLFDRMQIAFLTENDVITFALHEVAQAFTQGHIDWETPVFNNSITILKDLSESWTVPLKESWLAAKIRKAVGLLPS